MEHRIKVAVADAVNQEFRDRWNKDLEGMTVEMAFVETRDDRALWKAVHGATVVITRNRPIDKEVLTAAGDSLRMVIKLSRWSVGVDLDACHGAGIRVENVPQMGCITVAEHAMTLLLMCSRDMIRSHQGVVSGAYRGRGLVPEVTSERSFAFKWLPVNPVEPYGRTLGIVGFGEIGKELAVRARAFGMTVVYFDPQRPPVLLEQDLGVTYADLDDLLSSSDYISLHIPHTPSTEKLISASKLERMKPTAFLINACRGGVVDEHALVDALQNGGIAGAGLDVFVEEPLPHEHPLTRLPNVVLSPHIGGGAGTGRQDQRDAVRALINAASR